MTHSCCNFGQIKHMAHNGFFVFYVKHKINFIQYGVNLQRCFSSFELLTKQIRVQMVQMQNDGFELQFKYEKIFHDIVL